MLRWFGAVTWCSLTMQNVVVQKGAVCNYTRLWLQHHFFHTAAVVALKNKRHRIVEVKAFFQVFRCANIWIARLHLQRGKPQAYDFLFLRVRLRVCIAVPVWFHRLLCPTAIDRIATAWIEHHSERRRDPDLSCMHMYVWLWMIQMAFLNHSILFVGMRQTLRASMSNHHCLLYPFHNPNVTYRWLTKYSR